MNSRNGNAVAAAPAAAPQYHHIPHALLALPDLDRPPAIMEMWELEAVAAALPAKKRRLRETFDRLAASAPAPLPFRWDDLDAYISSLQFSATLRHRQQRELHGPSRPGPAPAAAGEHGVHPTRALEKSSSRPVDVPAPVPIPPVVPEPPIATGRDVHALDESSEPGHDPAPPAPAAVPAPAATGVDVGKGKKRKAIRVPQDARVQMPKTHEDAAAAAASPLEDTNCDGVKSRPVPPGAADAGNGLAAAAAAAVANASTEDATAQVADHAPIGNKFTAVVPQEKLPASEPAAAPDGRARPAGRLPPQLQRSRRPPRPSAAASAAPAVGMAGCQEAAEAANQKKTPMQDDDDSAAVATNASSHEGGGEAEASPCPSRPGVAAQVGADPIGRTTGVRHESPAATPHRPGPKVASFTLVVPKQEPEGIEEEVPDVEMEIVDALEAEEEKHVLLPNNEDPDVEPEEMPAALFEDDAPVANEKASPLLQVKAAAHEVKVSPLALARSNGSLALQAGVQQRVDATSSASATVCRTSPAATHDVPNVVLQASAATGLVPPAGSREVAAGKVSPPCCRADGLAQRGVSTVAACKSAPAGRHSSPAAARRGVMNATDDLALPAAGREVSSGPPQGIMAPPKASSNNKHVLQKQHMPNKQAYYHEPISSSSAQKQSHSFSRNHGGRHPAAGSQPVPEAQAATTARWNKMPGEKGRGSPGNNGGFAAARGVQQGDGGSRNNKGYNAKWNNKPPMFCNKCGCRGHLAETCRTAKHLVALYLRAKEEDGNQICYRCGCIGHWSRKCRTPKHLVDLYQKDRAAKRAAARGTGSP
ncbi:unnamed protein product [Urochloa humidicola]